MQKGDLQYNPVSDRPSGSAYLELAVSDFGPISKGKIVLKPLTIFVGPNSSGKSHVATIIHSVINAESELFEFALNDTVSVVHGDIFLSGEALSIYQEHVINGHDVITSSIHTKMSNHLFQVFPEILVRNFSTPLTNLIRTGQKFFSIDVNTRGWNVELDVDSSGVGGGWGSNDNLEIEFTDQKAVQEKLAAGKNHATLRVIVPRNSTANDIYNILKKTIQQQRRRITRSIYFPAERGGLTLSHKSIISNYYDRLGKLSNKSPDPSLSGTATDFLKWLIHIPKNEGPLARIARDFEAQALGGEVVMKQDSVKVPDLYFKQSGIDIPLHNTSSSIKDLAIFLLCVKHAIKPHDLIILEAPEANLHPINQIRMARLIAQMVNAGLHMLVSTHSEFFLEQLGHCVLAHTTKDKSKSVLPVSEILNISDVAAYRFTPDDGGYRIQSILSTDGIQQTEFTDVFDSQYDELLDIRSQQT